MLSRLLGQALWSSWLPLRAPGSEHLAFPPPLAVRRRREDMFREPKGATLSAFASQPLKDTLQGGMLLQGC